MDLGGAYSNKYPQVEALEALLRRLPDPTNPADHSPKRSKLKRARQLADDKVETLIQQYETGSTTRALANKYGINRRTVSAILQRNGVEPRYRRLTPGQIDDAVCYYQTGRSLARIGERFDVDPTTVVNRLRGRGIPTRDPQGRPRPAI